MFLGFWFFIAKSAIRKRCIKLIGTSSGEGGGGRGGGLLEKNLFHDRYQNISVTMNFHYTSKSKNLLKQSICNAGCKCQKEIKIKYETMAS